MGPNSHVEYARLRLETSNAMMKLKMECEVILEDPGVPLEDKTNHVKEKVQNALLLVSSIQGQLSSSLALAKTLVSYFSKRVHARLQDINISIKNSHPKLCASLELSLGLGSSPPISTTTETRSPPPFKPWTC